MGWTFCDAWSTPGADRDELRRGLVDSGWEIVAEALTRRGARYYAATKKPNGLTFIFVAFAIHHVYSAILVDIEERTGVMSSIFSGYKNIRPAASLEALGLLGHSPEEAARTQRYLDTEDGGKRKAEPAPETTPGGTGAGEVA